MATTPVTTEAEHLRSRGTLILVLLIILVALLAFANGANDNCKGVAAMVGYGAATPRQALIWAMLATAGGATVSFWFAGGLIRSFSTGLFTAGTGLGTSFFIAVLIGSFGWVIVATRLGWPVSTTHAITGALTGAGLMAFGLTPIQWGVLGTKFAVPLAVGPVLSMAAVYVLGWPVAIIATRVVERCVCVISEFATPSGGTAVAVAPRLDVLVADEKRCAAQEPVAKLTGATAAVGLHWLGGGAISFARGWNDAPKIAALGVVGLVGTRGTAPAFAVVTIAMAIGGVVAGRRVLETLARKVTPLPLAESLTASFVTAALVGMASWNGLPVSTTHVATGAIIGAGLQRDPRAVRWSKVSEIVLSWLVTVPVAALIAALAAGLVKWG